MGPLLPTGFRPSGIPSGVVPLVSVRPSHDVYLGMGERTVGLGESQPSLGGQRAHAVGEHLPGGEASPRSGRASRKKIHCFHRLLVKGHILESSL
jgi:hypothetical protein